MQVLVLSAGRSGTNIMLTALSQLEEFELSDPIENKAIFYKIGAKYKDGYLTKSDIVYTRSWLFLALLMQNNPEMRIIWTIRHPYDWALAKINRGSENGADDATFEGCISDLYRMYDLYKRLIKFYSSRVYTVKMENILLYTESVFKEICKWLDVEYKESMLNFSSKMVSGEKKERYSNIDKSQINMYEDLKYVNSIANKSSINIELLFNFLQPLVFFFRY